MRISDWSSDVCSSDLLLRLRRRLLTRLEQWQPDLYIGIDAPDFNLPVERRLKARGITTVHYVSPSLWAWRTGRARRIGESADCVLCLFPMEPPIYQRYGLDARFEIGSAPCRELVCQLLYFRGVAVSCKTIT